VRHIANKSSLHSQCHENNHSCNKYLVELFVLMSCNVDIVSGGWFVQTTVIFCSFGLVVQIFSEEFHLTCLGIVTGVLIQTNLFSVFSVLLFVKTVIPSVSRNYLKC